MHLPSHESEWSFVCVRGIDITSLYDYNIIFRNCSDSVVLFVFHFIVQLLNLNYYSLTHSLLSPNMQQELHDDGYMWSRDCLTFRGTCIRLQFVVGLVVVEP